MCGIGGEECVGSCCRNVVICEVWMLWDMEVKRGSLLS